jgi:hypothetical protein
MKGANVYGDKVVSESKVLSCKDGPLANKPAPKIHLDPDDQNYEAKMILFSDCHREGIFINGCSIPWPKSVSKDERKEIRQKYSLQYIYALSQLASDYGIDVVRVLKEMDFQKDSSASEGDARD